MEQLPYIDEHSIVVGATRERVWGALVSALHRDLGTATPGPLRRLLQLVPAERRWDRSGAPQPGDTLPGFEVAEAVAPKRLALCGRHRFSRYALVFELDEADRAECTLRAQTWAAFPDPAGRLYRTLVIGSGGHRLVVRRLLRHVADRA
jgi:hypothetical protein